MRLHFVVTVLWPVLEWCSESRFPGSWIPWGAWDLLVAFDADGRHHRKARASRKSIRGGKCEEMRRAFIRNWTGRAHTVREELLNSAVGTRLFERKSSTSNLQKVCGSLWPRKMVRLINHTLTKELVRETEGLGGVRELTIALPHAQC